MKNQKKNSVMMELDNALILKGELLTKKALVVDRIKGRGINDRDIRLLADIMKTIKENEATIRNLDAIVYRGKVTPVVIASKVKYLYNKVFLGLVACSVVIGGIVTVI